MARPFSVAPTPHLALGVAAVGVAVGAVERRGVVDQLPQRGRGGVGLLGLGALQAPGAHHARRRRRRVRGAHVGGGCGQGLAKVVADGGAGWTRARGGAAAL